MGSWNGNHIKWLGRIMRADYLSMSPFNVRCDWWLPEDSNDRIAGSVGFDGKNISCSIDSWFSTVAFLKMKPLTLDVLHGETVDGVRFSAFDLFATLRGSKVELIVNSLGVGANLCSLQNQRFTSAKAFINGLDVWQRCTPISETRSPDGTLSIQCPAPTGFRMTIPERLATISFAQSMNQLGGGRSIRIEYESYLEIIPNTPQTTEWFQKMVDESSQLFTLFLDQSTELTALRMIPVKESKDDLSIWPKVDEHVEWYWNRSNRDVEKIKKFKAIILSTDLQGSLEDVFRTWVSKTDQLKYARALLFSTLANPALFLETRFLPIIQAIEVYYKSIGSEKFIEAKEFELIKEELQQIVESKVTENGLSHKLKTNIGHSNEKGLKERVAGLLKSLDSETQCFVCQDADTFASLLTKTRNYYTHYSSSDGKKALEGNALHWATVQAALLLKIILMKECGVSESLIREKLNQSGWHKQGMTIWAQIEASLTNST